MREGTISACLYTADYLAALTISNGWRLVSFNHVFEHFGALQRLTLSSVRSSDQPTLIQLSDGLKFRILVQQRCLAQESRRGDPGISNGKRMGCLNPGGLEQQGFCLVNPLDWQRLQLFISKTPTPLPLVFPNPVERLHARDETCDR